MQINFKPKEIEPQTFYIENMKKTLSFFRLNLSSFSRQKYKLLKFLNIIKQKEYFFERFFMEHNSIFTNFSLSDPPQTTIQSCVYFLEEINNFYKTEMPRLHCLRSGIIYILSKTLLQTPFKFLGLLGKSNA